MQNIYPTPIGAKGLEAMRRGDNQTAFDQLNAAFAEGDNHTEVLLSLALAARTLSKFDKCLEAADQFLKAEPNHIHANVLKGDALAGQGNSRAAVSFYAAAVRLTAHPDQLPDALAQEVIRAQQFCVDAKRAYEEQMRDRLSGLGLADLGRRRIDQAVDILLGRQEVFLQQPSKFYLPELPQIQFFDPAQFSWAAEIEAAKDEIKGELTALLSNENPFSPYMAHNPIAPAIGDNDLYEDQKWSSFHLVQDGADVTENIKRCPRTYEIVSKAPIARIPGRSPNILFSRLEGGAHIPPHHGQINVRLLCHLPLIVPPGCGLRVGNQIRDVAEGDMMIFDDTIEHEARNSSNNPRIILIFDIWRPELSEEERSILCTIFEAIAAVE